MTNLRVGTIKWFGGLNSKTGKSNDFGFIDWWGEEIFFHRSQVISAVEGLKPDVSVVFRRTSGRGERPVALRVRIISEIPDDEIRPIIDDIRASPADVIRVLLSRTSLTKWNDEIVASLPLVDQDLHFFLLRDFWSRTSLSGLDDPLFPLAPYDVRLRTIREHYKPVRDLIHQLVDTTKNVTTGIDAATLYENINDQDKEIASRWTQNGRPAVYAKMLSARAAEIAAKKIYEKMGHSVTDISTTQLQTKSTDWLTHDLLLDNAVSVDVKNSRRAINAKNFYVEHTVPRFKLDRRGSNVRVAAFLSPYIKAALIDKPSAPYFPKEDVVFLGETSAQEMDKLSSTFDAPNFSVPRPSDRVFPNWVFTYPTSWYRELYKLIVIAELLDWPTKKEWEAAFSDLGKDKLIPAYCLLQKTLPASLSDEMWDWQIALYHRLQSVVGRPPNLPAIFLTILTDFISALSEQRENYTPSDYEQFLFVERSAQFPLYTIDPLQLVSNLLKTLETLWKGRGETRLERFKQFRFVGLGILQGRESQEKPWTTIVAYCGGIQYESDQEGRTKFDGGMPTPKGKCGHTPLIIGNSPTCPSCQKLICRVCSFCSRPCQERSLAQAASLDEERRRLQHEQSRIEKSLQSSEPPLWDVPLDAYEDGGRR